MLNLRKLDLSEAKIVENSYEYSQGYYSIEDEIGTNSFSGMGSLKSVILPNSVTKICGAAFANCPYLTDLVIGDKTLTIDDGGAFSCCNLKNITLNNKLKYIGSEAFYRNMNLETIVFNESLETISNSAFCQCYNLKVAKFSPGLKNIGDRSFEDCWALEEIMLPTSLQIIGNYSFKGCSSLKKVCIPATIHELGDYAFDTPSIKDIYTYTIEPTYINQNTFNVSLFTEATLNLPETAWDLYYWNTQWSQFQRKKIFNEPYEYFYLKNEDLEEYKDTPRLDGDPDADILAGSGLIVEGDEEQSLGEVTVEVDGKGNSGSIIGGSSDSTTSGGKYQC